MSTPERKSPDRHVNTALAVAVPGVMLVAGIAAGILGGLGAGAFGAVLAGLGAGIVAWLIRER